MSRGTLPRVIRLLESAAAAIRSSDAAHAARSLEEAGRILVRGALDAGDRLVISRPLDRLRLTPSPSPLFQAALASFEMSIR